MWRQLWRTQTKQNRNLGFKDPNPNPETIRTRKEMWSVKNRTEREPRVFSFFPSLVQASHTANSADLDVTNVQRSASRVTRLVHTSRVLGRSRSPWGYEVPWGSFRRVKSPEKRGWNRSFSAEHVLPTTNQRHCRQQSDCFLRPCNHLTNRRQTPADVLRHRRRQITESWRWNSTTTEH